MRAAEENPVTLEKSASDRTEERPAGPVVDLNELSERIAHISQFVKLLRESEAQSSERLKETLRMIEESAGALGSHTSTPSAALSPEGSESAPDIAEDGARGDSAVEGLIHSRIADVLDENRRLKEELASAQTDVPPDSAAAAPTPTVLAADDDEDLASSIVALLRSLIDATADGLLAVDPEGTTILSNRRLLNLCGLPEKTTVPTEGDAILRMLAETATNGEDFISRSESIPYDSDEETLDFLQFADGLVLETVSRPLVIAGAMIARVWIFREVTDRSRADGTLYEAETRYQRFMEDLNLGFAACDLSGRIVDANDRGAGILGKRNVAALRGTNLLTHPPFGDRGIADTLKHALENGGSACVEYSHKKDRLSPQSGRLHIFPVHGRNGALIRLHLLFEDVSGRKRAEELVLRSQRLIMLGQMSSGLSHTFSNLLQVVSGNANMALTSLELDELVDVKQHIEQIVQGSAQAVESIRLVQQFAKERSPADTPQKDVFDLSGVVAEACELCKLWSKPQLDKKRVDVEQELDLTPECMVEGDRDQVLWVVVNLVKNAFEALPDGGKIRIQTTITPDQVRLLVQDNGPGIPEEDIRRITSAFWTSKESHAGMGLTVNSEIIRRHAGSMGIKRVKPHGTAFTVKLPKAARPAPAPAPTEPKSADVEPQAGQAAPAADSAELSTYSILLIDDERAVGMILSKGLRKRGNTAYVAMSGAQGLKILRGVDVDAIVCDLGMEGMNGWEVSEAVQDLCEETGKQKPPFILLTGWGGQLGEDELVYHPHVDRIVEKPVTIPTILEIVGEEVRKKSGG